LLRALPLIVDSLPFSAQAPSSPSLHLNTPLNLSSPAVRESSFKDLLSNLSEEWEFEIELLLKHPTSSDSFSLTWTLREFREFRTHLISKFELLKNQEKWWELWWKEGVRTRKYRAKQYFPTQEEFEIDMRFAGLIPQDGELAKIFTDDIQVAIDSFQWLSSVRSAPLRFNPFQGTPNTLTPDGEGAAAILANDSMDSKVLFSKVSSWYEKYFGQKLVVEENSDFFKIMLQPVDAPYKVNIVDTGEGLIQVLPVLVAGAMTKAGSVLAIEEPESHLQPRYHAALAEYFVELVKSENVPKMLFETHSRNFLLRLQLAVARKEIDPDLIVVYWVQRHESGESVVREVKLDYLGGLLGEWDRDAFHTDVELSRQLIQAQREYL